MTGFLSQIVAQFASSAACEAVPIVRDTDLKRASGVLYGIAVYCFMSLFVLRFSAYHVTVTVPPIGPVIRDIAVHIFMVGLPIAFVVRKFSS